MPKRRFIYAISIKEATSLFNTIHKYKIALDRLCWNILASKPVDNIC